MFIRIQNPNDPRLPKPQPYANEFCRLYQQLAEQHPESLAAANHLAGEVVDPATANADAVWGVLWNKPLFANARVAAAKNWINQLEPHMANAWEVWGTDAFQIVRNGPGIAAQNFTLQGTEEGLIAPIGQTTLAKHRLFYIQGAAQMLRARAENAERPFAALVNEPLTVESLRQLQAEFGPGWGPITVLHALTDFGVAVKPDLHLVRSIQHLGFVPDLPPNLQVPNRAQAVAINEAVLELLIQLDGAYTPAGLRWLDKILMEMSRMGLLANGNNGQSETLFNEVAPMVDIWAHISAPDGAIPDHLLDTLNEILEQISNHATIATSGFN